MYYLGIDIGTGGSRALLIDEQGAVRVAVTVEHEAIYMQRPLWAEQHPDDWWRAAQEAIRGVLAQAGCTGADVRAIGLSGQMHGLTLLNAEQRVLRRALIWCDQRSQKQVDYVHTTLGMPHVLESLANPLVTGFTLPKLLWVREHEPELYAQVRHVLLPKDYIRLRLTGELATDVSDASGMAMFDVVGRRWSEAFLRELQIDPVMLPRVYESIEVTGSITAEAATLTGLQAGTPVVGGGGDQAASAVGNGIVEPGVVSCTIGTSGVVFAHMEKPAYDPAGRVHTFCHAVPNKWHVMGVTQGAGLSLQWYRNTFLPGQSYDDLTHEAAQAPVGSQGLYWLPYLMGERTPHLDAQARGGWIGITAKHTRADMTRAVIEGISYSLRDCLEIISGLGIATKTVRASGGGAKSLFWRQLLADLFGMPITTLVTQEGSAYGAALLAMAQAGPYASVPEMCRAVIHETERVEPRPAEQQHYAASHRVYQSLYPALQPLYGTLSADA